MDIADKIKFLRTNILDLSQEKFADRRLGCIPSKRRSIYRSYHSQLRKYSFPYLFGKKASLKILYYSLNSFRQPKRTNVIY